MRVFVLCSFLAACAALSACDSGGCGRGTELVDGKCVRPKCAEGCGAHRYCDESSEYGSCECVAGYDGDPCVWTGVVLDAEFKDPEIWSTSGGANILPFFDDGSGAASLAASVICNAGEVSQVVDMPLYEDGEPLVAEVTYRASQVDGLGLALGRAFTTLSATGPDEWRTVRVCLGEAAYSTSDDAYGGPVELALSASDRSFNCPGDTLGLIEVDKLRFDVASRDDECPDVGTVFNGEAEPADGGWLFEVDPPDESTLAEASLGEGIGRSATGGARLYKSEGGARAAAMAVSVSVPSAATLPSPSLRFWWKASEQSSFTAGIGTFRYPMPPLGTLVGTAAWREFTYCLPPRTQGTTVHLGFSPATYDSTLATELIVDDVELLSDDRCGVSSILLDGSFDSAPNQWPGVYDFGSQTSGESVAIKDDAANARTGRGVLEMTYTANDQFLRFETSVLVPQSEGTAGPQLQFYSKVPTGAPMPVQSFLGRSPTPSDLVLPSEAWEFNDVCLPPKWAGRWLRVQVRIGPSLEAFEVFDPPMQIYLDDFEVATSEGCPAE